MRKLANSELGRMTVDEFKLADKIPLVVVLDNVRSMNNIGSVFRTSDGFRVKTIYLCGITASPPHRDIQKTALGSTESMEWKYFESTKEALSELKNEQYRLIAIEQAENSTMLNDFVVNKDEKIAVIFGNEVKGVSDDVMKMIDECIEIPQYGTKHSLNISVSAGIVIWELFNKMNQ
jgi:tRNA G18 (ribose-2'-O)-methylase SpoU